eukprot:TRINITY_DN38063_c0_g1_i1.p1 TRINITY_DN38063_c0_g1~~TRINITY_DN38063_c0_g1_i1.p1  ORF type:complete len:359 (+),score=75.01 TRINITY_DN38063_c0_g1_i1:143-1219(+)
MTLAMEYRKDCQGGTLYASRNHNELRHTYHVQGANRAGVDWNLTLRQVRAKKPPLTSTASAPELEVAKAGESRKREPLACEHPDGGYHTTTKSVGKYQNYGATHHMLQSLNRVSSGSAHTIDWQLNLRDSLHATEHKPGAHRKPPPPPADGAPKRKHEEEVRWRRHFARPQVSFDMMKENCAAENDAYKKFETTPQDRRPDRFTGAISIGMIREDPMSFRRWPGCEGTNVGQWRHLMEDHSKGYKIKKHLQHETTLREYPDDKNGARISDSRSEGCLVEMLGKKKWTAAAPRDGLSSRMAEGGDPKLYHLGQLGNLPEADEANRAKRMAKQARTDTHISEARTPLRPKGGELDGEDVG